ncbi:MAG: nucleoside-diphosphate kinase [Syntrophomonadaceae bacterium]|jgi:nucleoside-diphosphate kinase|nr:nucleoside-diphosphate kinase [Syntrophomonadaceae bacterium]
MEQTFVMIKPDGVQRSLVGEIVSRIESKGFQLKAMKLMRITPELARIHYVEHEGKGFFNDLVEFITSGPVVAMVWAGEGVIASMRLLMGQTNPAQAAPGTIRGDLAVKVDQNIIHGSDSPSAAQREIELFFSAAEILDYQRSIDCWIF